MCSKIIRLNFRIVYGPPGLRVQQKGGLVTFFKKIAHEGSPPICASSPGMVLKFNQFIIFH